MCGRFMLDVDIGNIIGEYKIEKKEADQYNKGDILPSQNAPIVYDDRNRTLKLAKWGFPLSGKSSLVINARSESIESKPMFKNSFTSSRCIIPANLFYEWKDEGDNNKAKHKIYLKEKSIISLAGVFKFTLDDKGNKVLSFVIITTESNKYMKDLHPRMPLIIENNALDYWLNKNTPKNTIEEIIESNVSHELKIDREDQPFTQMTLF